LTFFYFLLAVISLPVDTGKGAGLYEKHCRHENPSKQWNSYKIELPHIRVPGFEFYSQSLDGKHAILTVPFFCPKFLLCTPNKRAIT